MIEIALVELRGRAMPIDLAQLSELLLDAREAEDEVTLARIGAQAASVRAFCEGRDASIIRPPRKKKRG